MLAAIGRHPRAGTLSCTREVVEVEQANDLAVTLHFKCSHLGFEHRNRAGIFGEAHAVQLARGIEHRGDHVIQLEIRLNRLLIEVILRLAHLFGVETIIPRLDCDLVRIGNGLHVRDFFFHACGRGWPNLHHQVHRLIRVLRHRVRHPIMRMGRKTEDFSALLTQFQDFGNRCVGVVRISVITPLRERAPDFFAQVAASRIFKEWLHRRTGVDHGPTALAL